MKTFNEYLNENSMTRFLSHTKKYQCGTISACVGNDCSKHKELGLKLDALGFGYITIFGVYTYENGDKMNEKSYFVFDIKNTKKLKEVLIKLGNQYNQESITFSEPDSDFYLINCNSKKEIKLGKPKFKVPDGQAYSSKNGNNFIFENYKEFNFEDFKVLNRFDSSEVYGKKLVVDEYKEHFKNYNDLMTFSKHKDIDLI